MRRLVLYVVTAVLTFFPSVGATYALNAAGDLIVNVIPIDDAPCWEETMIFCVLDAQGHPFSAGGETQKLSNCP